MKVNFDGMRRNATNSMNDLHGVIKGIIENDDIFDEEKEELIKKYNEAAQDVDMFNCLSDDNDENFNELELSVYRLEELEED